MRIDSNFHRYLDIARMPLFWGGWRSDSLTLRREGWELFGSEDMCDMSMSKRIRLTCTSPDKALAISGCFMLPFRGRYDEDPLKNLFDYGMQMQQYTAKDRVVQMPQMDVLSFTAAREIDLSEPIIVKERDFRFGSFEFFKYAQEETKEIYIPPQSVSECLDRILQLQYPEQQEIKKGLIMPEAKPLVQARILTLVA